MGFHFINLQANKCSPCVWPTGKNQLESKCDESKYAAFTPNSLGNVACRKHTKIEIQIQIHTEGHKLEPESHQTQLFRVTGHKG